MIIRALGCGDRVRWAALETQTFERAWTAATLDAELDRADSVCLGAFHNGSLDGVAVARRVGAEAELHRIAVAPSARRRGVGRDLLLELASVLGRRGATTIFLEVASQNRGARRLYEAVGFGIVGRRRGYYPNPPDDAVVMRLGRD